MDLVNNKTDREKLIERVDVLNRVKEIVTIPMEDVLTTRMVANYYEVEKKVIEKLYERNKKEIDEDGVKIVNGKDILKWYENLNPDNVSPFKITKIRATFTVNDIQFSVNNNLIWTKRSLLRVGMLLRDSEIAKEVRTQLLNGYEKLSDEQKTKDIDEELQLMQNIGIAYGTGNSTEVLIATQKLDEYRKNKIIQLENINDILSDNILHYEDRDFCNCIIRRIAKQQIKNISEIYSLLWNELKYNLKIDICARRENKKHISNNGKMIIPTMYDVVSENELVEITKHLVAWCNKESIDISDIIEKHRK